MIDRTVWHAAIAWFLIRVLIAAFTVAVVLTLLSWWLLPADSRELYPGQYKDVPPAVQEWFRSQKIPGTNSPCCNTADGVYAEEEIRGTQYWTRFITVGGTRVDWMPVPPSAVIDFNRNGSPVVWYYYESGGPPNEIKIRCYAPGGGV